MSKEVTTSPADKDHPHSIYGASCASRWRGCPGSVLAIEHAILAKRIPAESRVSKESEEGTKAHDAAEQLLKGKLTRDELTSELEPILSYTDYCFSLLGSKDEPFGIESVDPIFYRKEDFSTGDFWSLTEDGLEVVDYKHGEGIYVEVEDNSQLAIYGMNIIERLKDHPLMREDLPVRLTIVQPRHYRYDGPRTWETTVEDLRDFCVDVEADYKHSLAITEGEIPFEPEKDLCAGDWCQFCPIKHICEVRGRTNFGGLPPLVDVMTDLDDELAEEFLKSDNQAGLLTTEQIRNVIKHGPDIIKMIKNVTEGEFERLKEGGPRHHFKLVEGKLKARKWTDEKAAEKLIRGKLSVEEAFKPRVVISAPQADIKLKAWTKENGPLSTRFTNRFDSLIHRAPGTPKMVPIEAEGEDILKPPCDDLDNELDTELDPELLEGL